MACFVVILIHDHITRLAAGPLSASGSNHHPHANHQSIIREVPLTARIEGEVQDLPSNVLPVLSFAVTSLVSSYTVI